MNEEKIKAVLSDKAFVRSLLKLETPEEVQAALKERGIELSADEIKKAGELMRKRTNGTLSEAELEGIAGGRFGGFIGLSIGIVVEEKEEAVSGFRW